MKPQVTFRPLDPPGPPLTVALADGAAVDDPVGGGGWTTVSRPKRKSITDWVGYEPYGLTIPIVFDGFASGRSVEADLERLRRMMRVPTPTTGQPVVLRVEGPVPMTQLRWVIEDIEGGDEIRGANGQRQRAFQTVKLIEYQPADVVVERPSPAKSSAARRTTTPSTKTHTVRQGDTLSAIAARHLGKASRWTEIAKLNGVRDPRKLQIGTVLRLP